MWARVSRFQFPAAEVERAIEALNGRMAEFAGRPGLRHGHVLVSRKSGAGMTITLWDDLDAMKASADDADRLREDVALELIGWVEGVEEYELVGGADGG